MPHYTPNQQDIELFKNTCRLKTPAEKRAAVLAMTPDQREAFKRFVESVQAHKTINKYNQAMSEAADEAAVRLKNMRRN